VTAFPDVKIIQIEPSCEFILLGSGGLWEMKNSQEAIDFIHQHVYENNFSPIIDRQIDDLEGGLKKLVDSCCLQEKP
jgi:serine/threonine protein phosphatase PrpC